MPPTLMYVETIPGTYVGPPVAGCLPIEVTTRIRAGSSGVPPGTQLPGLYRILGI